MSAPTISTTAEAAREQARDDQGRFGVQPATEADVELDLPAQPAEPEEPEGFDQGRISSLMGDAYHLDPERKVALPRINEDDTIAQVHHKLNRYLAKTQDVSDLDDAEVAELAGFEHDPNAEMPDELRKNFGISDGDRVVTGVNSRGYPVYISAGNTAKKTGTYYHRWGGDRTTFEVHNIAEHTIQPQMQAEFAEDHPEVSAGDVDTLFRRLNGSYRGKGHRWMWTEDTLSRGSRAGVALTRARAGVDLTGVAMPADEVRDWLETLPRNEAGEAVVSGPHGEYTLNTSGIESDLAGTSPHAAAVHLNRSYRAWVTEKLADEYDFTLQRKYVRDNSGEGGARVFEQKKNVPQTHLDAAENSAFRTTGDFRHVEVDADTDLDKLARVGAEYEHLRAHLPRTSSTPALRFRKTGRHQALGVYHPHVDNIAVDPRHPSSFVHEFTHHLDHTAGDRNLSGEDDFKPILRRAQAAVSTEPALSKKADYYRTPTEVHARSAELYFHWKGLDTSLNGDDDKYGSDPAYTSLEPMKDEIVTYWDAKLAELGADPVPQRG